MRPKEARFLSAIISTVAIFGGVVTRGDDFFWQPSCDIVWQTCCELDPNTMTNNWGRFSPAPICPALPSGADNVTIVGDCIVGPPAGSAAGVLDQSGGTFTLNGPLAIGTAAEFDGPFVWTAGELARSGGAAAQYARMNHSLSLVGSADKTLSSLGGFRLINAASGSWSGTGNWTIGMIPGGCCPAIFENAAGAAFTIATDADILQTGFGPGRIENHGTFVKDGTNGLSEWAATFINTGTLHVKSGEVRLIRGGSASGTFVVDSGATLSFSGEPFTLSPGANITGQGDALVTDSSSGNSLLINDTITLGRIAVTPTGRIGGTGWLQMSNRLTVDAGDVDVNTRILPGARLDVTGFAEFRFRALEIGGVANIPSGTTLAPLNNALAILAGGEIQIEDGGVLAPGGNGVQPIENFGTLRKMPGNGVGIVASAFGWHLNNHAGGRIAVEGGLLACSSRLDTAGEIHIAAGATMKHQHWGNYHPGATFTGDGWLHFENTSNNFIDDGFTLVIPRFRVSGIINAGHGISGPGNLTVTHELDLQGGGLFGPLVTLPAGSQLTANGPNPSSAYGSVESRGMTRIVSGDFSYGGTFHNDVGATIDLQSDFYFGGRFGNGVLNNQGTFVKSAGAGDTDMNGTFNNAGLVRLQSGRVTPDTYVQSAGTTRLEGGGLLSPSMTLNGGTLSGAGTLHVNMNNVAGVIAPGASAGRLTIASSASPSVGGDFSQGANGSLRVEIGGLTPGTEHDQLVIARHANLNGGLNIDVINNFSPELGDQFVILTLGGIRAGQFAHVSGVQLGGGLRFNVHYNPDNVTLIVAAGGTIPGDIDGDGHVAIGDLTLLLSSFGLCDGRAGFNAGADLDGDGCVSITDLTTLLSNYGM
jgi:hypothetical protein